MSVAKLIEEQVRVNRTMHDLAERAERAVGFLLLFEDEISKLDEDDDLKKALWAASDRLGELLQLLDADFWRWRDRQVDLDNRAVRP